MEFLVVAVVVGVILFLAARGLQKMGRSERARNTDPPAPPEPPTKAAPLIEETNDSDALSPAPSIQELAATLAPIYDSSADPEALADDPVFQHAVALLSDPAVPLQRVVNTCLGANPAMATAAAAALRERADIGTAVQVIVDYVKHANVWMLFFLLRFLATRPHEPVVARVLLQARDWWPRSALLPKMLSDFIDVRAATGESIDLRSALGSQPCEHPDELESVLDTLPSPHAQALRKQLQDWRRERIDVGLLSGIGRIWRAADSADVMVTPPIEAGLATARRALDAHPPESILVVGEPGVGKTSLVRCLARQLSTDGWTVFEASASEIIAGQVYVGELEQRMRALLAAVSSDKRVLWYVPAFHETFYAGRHRYSPVGVLDLLLPAVEAGRVCIIGEVHPGALEKVLQQRPRLRNMFRTIQLEPLPAGETLALAGRICREQDGANAAPVAPEVLDDAFELARNYLTATMPPGNLLDLLRQARTHASESGAPPRALTRDDLLATLSELTGLPRSVIDERTGLDAAALRTFLQARVMGQPEAVSCLVDRIAMLKAGLTDPRRPIGVFLFAGPTGTGKTEVAKTLAEYLFGSVERMIRLDMSEFQESHSLARILGEAGDGRDTQALVDRIRRQPFSVLLLDEFEKAHPRIWDLFLQVFDDGRLTDAHGNVADFRHSIIILTSNLGATEHRGTSLGFTHGAGEFGDAQVMRAITSTFRPEFVNRIDRVVVFRPLSKSVMRDILRKELRAVLDRRGFRNRDWAVEWEESAIELLLDKGFTRDMGARPLRRAIDEHVLAPIAMTIVENRFPEGDQFLFVRGAGERIEVEFVDPDAPTDAPTPVPDERLTYAPIIVSPRGGEPERAFLEGALARIEARLLAPEWIARKQELLQQMARAGFWEDPTRHGVLVALEHLDSIEAALGNAQSLMRRLQPRPGRAAAPASITANLAQQLYLIDHALSDLELGRTAEIFLGIEVIGEAPGRELAARRWSERLLEMYRDWARKRRLRLAVLRSTANAQGPTHVASVTGFGVHGILLRETGMHVWEVPDEDSRFERCTARVRIAAQPVGPRPPGGSEADFAAM
ncbi:MAG: AAA family ATPase, partial [Burkholderiales bacterium]|nr:AAA family ATPase [Burkholderiales bacterium]